GVHLAVGLEKRHHIVLGQHGQAALGLQVSQTGHAYPLALRGLRLPLYSLRHTTPPFLSMSCSLSKEKTLEKHTPYDWPCKDFFARLASDRTSPSNCHGCNKLLDWYNAKRAPANVGLCQEEGEIMKLVLFDDYRLGVIQNNRVVDAMAALAGLQFRRPQDLI